MGKKVPESKPLSEEEQKEQIRQIDEVFPDSSPAYRAKKKEIERLMYLKHPDDEHHENIIYGLVKHALEGNDPLFLISLFVGFIAGHRYSHGSDIEPTHDDYLMWLDSMTVIERGTHAHSGFEACKQHVRVYIQRKRMSQADYLQAKLTPDDLRLFHSSLNHLKLKYAKDPANLPQN